MENRINICLLKKALLQTQLVMGWSPAAIPPALQRARSTITRKMACGEGLRLAETNRFAAAGKVVRVGESGLAVRLQLRRP
jgi:hypothetical protein